MHSFSKQETNADPTGLTPQSTTSVMEEGIVSTLSQALLNIFNLNENVSWTDRTMEVMLLLIFIIGCTYSIIGTLLVFSTCFYGALIVFNGTDFKSKSKEIILELIDELKMSDLGLGSVVFLSITSCGKIYQFFDLLYTCNQSVVVQMVTTWLSVCCTALLATNQAWYCWVLVSLCYFITGFFFYKDYKMKQDEIIEQTMTNFIIKAANAIQLLRGAKTTTDWACNLALIYKQFDSSEIELLERALSFAKKTTTETFTAASEDFSFGMALDDIEERWKFFKTLRDSELYDSTKKFGMYFILSGCSNILGEEINESQMFEEIRKRGKTKIGKMDADALLIDIVDTTISLLRTWHTIIIGDNMYEALKSKDEVLCFVTEYEEIVQEFDKSTLAEINQIEMDKKLRTLCTAGRRIKGGPFSNRIASMLNDLKNYHRTLLVQMANNGIRALPFGILLVGPSGVGKSYLTDVCGQLYLKYTKQYGYNLDIDEWLPNVHKYYRNVVDKFWSLYDGQWFVVIDDLAQERATVLEKTDTNSVKEIILVMNNAPFATTQAQLEKKGTTPLMARCVVGTTNTKDLNARYVFECPEAALRRFPFVIEATVKDEFKLPNTQQLNPSMRHYDSWNFRIEQVQLVDGNVEYKKLHKERFVGMRGLQDFFEEYAPEHEKQQKNLFARFNTQLNFCPECDAMEGTCDCSVNTTNDKFIAASFSDYEFKKDPSGFFRRQYEKFGTRTNLAKFGLAITALFVFKKIISMRKDESFSTANDPNVKGESPWFKETDDIMAFISTPSRCSRLSDLTHIIQRNIFWIHVKTKKTDFRLRAFGLYGKVLVTNKHPFMALDLSEEMEITVTCGRQDQPIKDKVILHMKRSNLTEGEKDLLFITHSDLREVKDVRKYLSEQIPVFSKGQYWAKKGEWVDVPKCAKQSIEYKHSDGATYRSDYLLNVKSSESVGTCGGVIVGNINGANLILGISCAVSDKRPSVIAGVHIDFKKIPHFEDFDISEGDYFYAANENPLGDMVPLHSKSFARHETLDGIGIPICSLTNARVTHKSNTIYTPFAGTVAQFNETPLTHGPPNFISGLVDGVYTSPELKSLDARIHNESKHDWNLMLLCAQSLVDEIAAVIDLSSVQPVSTHIAINGVPGAKFIDPLNMASSGGFRYPGAKRKYFEGEPGSLTPNSSISYWLSYLKQCAKMKQRANVIFNATFKDEALSNKKRAIGKVRTFFSCPVDFIILMREQFLTLCAQLMSHGLELGISAGLDCYKQWGQLYSVLNKFGTAQTLAFAGDYKNYDAEMSGIRIHFAFYVLIKLCAISGNFSMDDLNTQKFIRDELCHPNVNFWGTLVKMFGGQISGSALTLINNCLVNMLDMRYCYAKALNKHPRNFVCDVSATVMGDDNNACVRVGVPFGHTTLMNELAKLGITYTMADKTSKSIMWQSLFACDFLKRNYEPSVKYSAMLCPLDFSSIFKMLTTVTKSKAVPLECQLGAIIGTANREIALHGEAIYNKWHQFLCTIIEDYELQPWVHDSFYWDYDAIMINILTSERPIGEVEDEHFQTLPYESFTAASATGPSVPLSRVLISILMTIIKTMMVTIFNFILAGMVSMTFIRVLEYINYLNWKEGTINNPITFFKVDVEDPDFKKVQRTYRQMSLKYHPDKPTGNEAKMLEINQQFSLIDDEEKFSEMLEIYLSFWKWRAFVLEHPGYL